MRTTLTLDDDVAAKLRTAARRSGRAFRDVVNETLRRGLLAADPSRPPRQRFKASVRDLGTLRPGLNLDNIGDLLDRTEGPLHR